MRHLRFLKLSTTAFENIILFFKFNLPKGRRLFGGHPEEILKGSKSLYSSIHSLFLKNLIRISNT